MKPVGGDEVVTVQKSDRIKKKIFKNIEESKLCL